MTRNGQSPGERGLVGAKHRIVDTGDVRWTEVRWTEDGLSASEAIYGFCAWLTCREERICMGSAENCAPVVELIKAFCERNDLADPRDGWEDNLTHPKDD